MTDEPEEPPPAMIGRPPSASQVPLDPGLHAKDFARRWSEPLDQYCASRMAELGMARERIGSSDHTHGIHWCAFNPNERTAGGVATGGRITVDSGVLNPEHLSDLDHPAPEA